MDLAGIINNGEEALHRGSVDKTASTPSTPARSNSPQTTESNSDYSPSKKNPRNSTTSAKPVSNNIRAKAEPPSWARVHRYGVCDRRDEKRFILEVTRPELKELFNSHETSDRPVNSRSLEISPFIQPARKVSDIGPGGTVSLTGLAASFANLIPNDDQTKTLAAWIFEKVEQIKDTKLLNSIEIEFKIGKILDRYGRSRYLFPVVSESVIDGDYYKEQHLKFVSGVEESSFKVLEKLLDSIELSNSDSAENPIIREMKLIRDEAYDVTINGVRSRARVSFDERDQVLECINKERVGDLYMTLPNSQYDLKMSMSIEKPIDFESISTDISEKNPRFERSKNRVKYIARGCTVDLTSAQETSSNGHKSSKECEVEANIELLSSILHDYRDHRDKSEILDKFLEVIRYTMDSARFLVRSL